MTQPQTNCNRIYFYGIMYIGYLQITRKRSPRLHLVPPLVLCIMVGYVVGYQGVKILGFRDSFGILGTFYGTDKQLAH